MFSLGKRVAFNPTANLAATDRHALTTIVNLYDILSILYSKIVSRRNIDELKHYRPCDDELERYYKHACDFFGLLKESFPPLDQYFAARDYTKVVRQHRGSFGGNVLFRPIGLLMMTEVIAVLSRKQTLAKAVRAASRLPLKLSRSPYLELVPKAGGRQIRDVFRAFCGITAASLAAQGRESMIMVAPGLSFCALGAW
jgi:DNA sulfur modification protein DndB